MAKTTWKPHTQHGELDSSDRTDLPDDVYAFPEQRTGVAALSKLAQSAVPAVVAVSKLAGRIERQSGQWADRVAGRTAKPRNGSAFRQARARRPA